MVHPVRAVGYSAASGTDCALYTVHRCGSLGAPRRRTCVGWGYLSPAEGARDGSSLLRIWGKLHSGECCSAIEKAGQNVRPANCGLYARSQFDGFEGADWLSCISNLFASLVWGRPSLIWEPWPMEPPAIDRVKIHWPSDDWPPTPEECVIEEQAVGDSPQVGFVVDRGSLIDMWG